GGRRGLTAKQAPRRPGTAPAHGLRARTGRRLRAQTNSTKETTMWFHTPLRSRRLTRHHEPRLQLQALEDPCLLSGAVTLAPSDGSPLVGEPVTWTATAVDVGAAPVYQFSAAPHGGAFHVVRDFSPANSFTWTPMREGSYDIQVTVKDGYQAAEATSAVVTD